MEPSIFTRIINGDIPSHKIYEDDTTFAFLDIHPAQPGHMLVVPKAQVDRLEELGDKEYAALMSTVKMLMQHVINVLGADYRACLKLEGFDVPHAHVHIIPCKTAKDFWAKQRMDIALDHSELASMAKRLRIE
ncbi:MAG TPA: HIT family protein [Candidatus Saccharimonadales bacterium]